MSRPIFCMSGARIGAMARGISVLFASHFHVFFLYRVFMCLLVRVLLLDTKI